MTTAITIDNELEALLAPATAKPIADLDDLDALLSESMALKDEEAHIKFLREKRKKGKASAAELAEDEARIREWEAKREWETKSNVGVFDEVTCTCGNVDTVFSHLMHYQVHRERKLQTRFILADVQIAALPNQVAKQIIHVGCCTKCAPINGWELASEPAFVWEGEEV